MPQSAFEAWKYEVDRQFRIKTHCSWADLCGDNEPLTQAFEAGTKAQTFVDGWIELYDLTDYSSSAV